MGAPAKLAESKGIPQSKSTSQLGANTSKTQLTNRWTDRNRLSNAFSPLSGLHNLTDILKQH